MVFFGDYRGTHIKFKTKQDAINFAEKQGYPYFVQEPQHARIPPKSYSDNFRKFLFLPFIRYFGIRQGPVQQRMYRMI